MTQKTKQKMVLCDCKKLRRYHSTRNWLGKGTIYKIQTPYSSISTFFSCSLPFTVIILIISYVMYTYADPTKNDNEFTIRMKDADVHHRPSHKYYDHFYGNLTFKIKDSRTGEPPTNDNITVTMHQHYSGSRNKYSNWACSDYLNINPLTINMHSENNWTAQGFLCFRAREFDFFVDGSGLFLCRDGFDETVLSVDIIYMGPNLSDSKKKSEIIKQRWIPNQSIIITLELHILYNWYESSSILWGSSPIWDGNDFVVKSVEYDTQQFNRPQTANQACHGIKILMDRNVYEITDGTGVRNDGMAILALLGGIYSFVVLAHSILAVICEYMAQYCCKERYNKDLKFAIAFHEQQDRKVEMIENKKVEMIEKTND
eukprot:442806_1